jgi:hypothetical protein
MTIPPRRATPELNALVDLFYPDSSALGAFVEVAEAELPAVARRLLAHDKPLMYFAAVEGAEIPASSVVVGNLLFVPTNSDTDVFAAPRAAITSDIFERAM